MVKKADTWEWQEAIAITEEEHELEYGEKVLIVHTTELLAGNKRSMLAKVARDSKGDQKKYRADLVDCMLEAKVTKVAGHEMKVTDWEVMPASMKEYLAWALVPDDMMMNIAPDEFVKKLMEGSKNSEDTS